MWQNFPTKINWMDHFHTLKGNTFLVASSKYSNFEILDRKVCNKIVQLFIQDIYDRKPAGLIHARILSEVIKKSIRIWHGNHVIYVFGNKDCISYVDVEYSERIIKIHRKNHLLRIGHWTLRGGRNPVEISSYNQNDCLYTVIASQTGFKTSELRRRTANAIRKNHKSAAKMIVNHYFDGMFGGARYAGSSPRDAQRVLDASQNGQCHPQGWPGHPRGHASHPSTGRSEDSVETYSYSRWRSGFLSRSDQDLVCHYTLITSQAQDLMAALNNGREKVDAHIGRHQLDYDPLPQANKWDQGKALGSPDNFRTVCLVGKHFLNCEDDARADIFIVTFYPIL